MEVDGAGVDLIGRIRSMSQHEPVLLLILTDDSSDDEEMEDTENNVMHQVLRRPPRVTGRRDGSTSGTRQSSTLDERMRTPLSDLNVGEPQSGDVDYFPQAGWSPFSDSSCSPSSVLGTQGSVVSSEGRDMEDESSDDFDDKRTRKRSAYDEPSGSGQCKKRLRLTERMNTHRSTHSGGEEAPRPLQMETNNGSGAQELPATSCASKKKRKRRRPRWTNGTKESRLDARSKGRRGGTRVSHPVEHPPPPKQSGPAADGGYSYAERRKLRAAMQPKCQFCGQVMKRRTMVLRHLLFTCDSIGLPPRLQTVLDGIRQNSGTTRRTAVPARVFKYEPCPQNGICEVLCSKFPSRTYCAPHNWLCINMDVNLGKGQSALKRTRKAQLYKNKFTGEVRRRFYTDKPVHEAWERMMRAKIRNDEVDELLIPATFWYQNADMLSTLQGCNHASLISVKFRRGKWTEAVFYDSLQIDRYYQKAACLTVRACLNRKLLPTISRHEEYVGKEWLRRAEPYKSLATAGCQGVVAFWLHLKYLGRDLVHPLNTGTVFFFKALLHHVRPNHPLMRGEEFDRNWTLKRRLNGTRASCDPEMRHHVMEYRAIMKAFS